MIKQKDTPVSDSDAVFLGWQETISGGAIALYNITVKSHPSYGSTVTDRILRNLKLQIPERHSAMDNRKNQDTWKRQKRGGEYTIKTSMNIGVGDALPRTVILLDHQRKATRIKPMAPGMRGAMEWMEGLIVSLTGCIPPKEGTADREVS